MFQLRTLTVQRDPARVHDGITVHIASKKRAASGAQH